MRRSSRTAAAMKNYKSTLATRGSNMPSEPEGDLVARGTGGTREVAPDVRRMIDEALARRRSVGGAG